MILIKSHRGLSRITAGGSPDGDALCIITDRVTIRSECSRLLAQL
ncbi:MAG: hypothetical protein RLZZ381_1098 [Cyanobacteriota bacterium]|jgi:hypothetical protein